MHVGEEFALEVEVTLLCLELNVSGVSPILEFTPPVLAVVSGPAPSSADLTPEQPTVVFRYMLRAEAPGEVRVKSTIAGYIMGEVAVSSVCEGVLLVSRVSCDITISVLPNVTCLKAGEKLLITAYMVNTGESDLTHVTPLITYDGTGEVELLQGPSPPAIDEMPAGASANVTWLFKAAGGGEVTFYVGAMARCMEAIYRSDVYRSPAIEIELMEKPPMEAAESEAPAIDLYCTLISANVTEPSLGEAIRVTAVVAASGAEATAFRAVFTLGEGYKLGEVAQSIKPGETREIWVDLAFTKPGEYRICLHIDPENMVGERNEENNVCCTTMEIPPVEKPPLTEAASPTSPKPPTTPTPPMGSETPPTGSELPKPAGEAPSASQPPPEREERKLTATTAIAVAIAAAMASAAIAYGYGRLKPTAPPLATYAGGEVCCCLDWNVRPGEIVLRTVKPVNRDIKVRDGRHKGSVVNTVALFAPVGGYLPLLAKGVNIDWIDARGVLKSCGSEAEGYGQSGGVAGSLSIPIPESLLFKWEIVSGPGYLLSAPPLSHAHSSLAEGPAAIYVAPPLIEEDPSMPLAERIKGREVIVKLTVDDLEGQLKGLDTPLKELYFRIILVGQGLELQHMGKPLHEDDLSEWADYSEVRDAVPLPEWGLQAFRVPEPASKEVEDIKSQLEKTRGERKAREKALSSRSESLGEERRKLDRALSELKEMEVELEDVERQLRNPGEAALRAREEARKKIWEKYMQQISELRERRRELWKAYVKEVSEARERGESSEYVQALEEKYSRAKRELSEKIKELYQKMFHEIDEAMREIGYPTVHPIGPGPRFEEYRRSLRERARELKARIQSKEREVGELRGKLRELEEEVEELRREVEELRSREANMLEGLRSAEARAEAEKKCRVMYEWEAYKPIRGEILAPLRLCDREPILGSELPRVEQLQAEVRPREILVLKARAEDVDKLRLWVEDGQETELEVKDWLRYKWSSKWADGRQHSMEPGVFLVTREGESTIFLAPEEEGEVEIACELSDSGAQGRDPKLELRLKLEVRGEDPFTTVEKGIKAIEEAITRPSERRQEPRQLTKRLGDLEEWILSCIQLDIAVMTGKLLDECMRNLKALWWSDLLWYMGNVLLATSGAPIGGGVTVWSWAGWAVGYGIAGGLIGYEGTTQLLSELKLAESSMCREWMEGLKQAIPPSIAEVQRATRASGLELLLYKTGASMALQERLASLLFEAYASQSLALWEAFSSTFDSVSDKVKSCFTLGYFRSDVMLALEFVRPSEADLSKLRERLERSSRKARDARRFYGMLSVLFTPVRYLTGSEEGFERVEGTLYDVISALRGSEDAAVSKSIEAFRNIAYMLRGELRLQKFIFDGLKSLRAQ